MWPKLQEYVGLGPQGKPNTIITLKEYSHKMTPNDIFLYPLTNASPTHIKEFSLYRFKPDKIPGLRRGHRHKFHPQKGNYLQLTPAEKRKISFVQ